MTENKSSQTSDNKAEPTTSKKFFFRRRFECPLANVKDEEISYKNPNLIIKFTSEGGRILPKRITNVSSKKQRKLKEAIKRARGLALLPFVYQN